MVDVLQPIVFLLTKTITPIQGGKFIKDILFECFRNVVRKKKRLRKYGASAGESTQYHKIPIPIGTGILVRPVRFERMTFRVGV